ncbi:MAG: RdgB/HAM1 family non-canonical purine NTP pyrophosphatase [Cellvibrionaceae bacterium]|nr:RdgB/HAM1 family non-canonical purine NTP pyrophosphatase [Cellvibrionaceae bacterium]
MQPLCPKIILASNNTGKLREFKQLFASHPIEIIPQGDRQISDAVEDGLSFVENAIIKARHACRHSGLPAIADDSGLEVDALAGEPGIYSARFAGEHGNDQANNDLLLKKLKGVPQEQRSARFQCVLAFMRHAADPTPLVCQASWEGFIVEDPKGLNGFGYDPLFWLPAKNCTSAQLPKDEKNHLSHRGQALKIFLEKVQASGLL